MRRLEAIFSESRNNGSRSSVGKTESSTARRICTAERKTMMDAAIESASNRSRPAAGNGISITKITLIAASGSTYSRNLCKIDCRGNGRGTSTVVLIAAFLQDLKRRSRAGAREARPRHAGDRDRQEWPPLPRTTPQEL